MGKIFKDEESAREAGETLLKTLTHDGFTVKIWGSDSGWYFTLLRGSRGDYYNSDRIEIHTLNDGEYWIDSRINGVQYYTKNLNIDDGIVKLEKKINDELGKCKKSYEELFK